MDKFVQMAKNAKPVVITAFFVGAVFGAVVSSYFS